MKIFYVTRHFNHSGYILLEKLIERGFNIEAVLLHKNKDKWRVRFFRFFLIFLYKVKCLYYRCQPLRTINSEEFLAKKYDIPIVWAESIKSDSFFKELSRINPDIIVLGGGWHELIPQRVYSFPKLGCLNTHPSLLPEFRGTSITRWQVLYGIEKSGSTIHYVDGTFDTGGILAQKEFKMSSEITPQQLFYELGHIGADIMVPLLKEIEKHGKKQTFHVEHNPIYYHYYKKWQWNEAHLLIDWAKSLKSIHYHILANTQESFQYLGPYFEYNKKKYIVRETELLNIGKNEKKYLENKYESNLYVFSIDNKSNIYILKKNCEFVLKIKKIQKFDKYYKYRRSYPANILLKMNKDQLFKKLNE
ncbi:formyltransferase family protein [Flavobacterium piscis]|uniref:Methionyl-tRNA formyltransferase n=1 Tax=Flavobacterium piscis TaxID=1114874 RepID=A0ABU1Y602_9FLAO|nr:formyltransferase family protein [Flavobacterium piscis]MDR7208966.1 methionyl-tRNA formyltransferase [Flavobacterium piscis]